MTNPQDIEFLICQYADGTLDSGQAKQVEELLATDPHYRQLLQQHRALKESLNDWGSRIPMVDWDAFHDRLGARLQRVQARPALQRRWMRGIAAAAAIAMAVTALMISERPHDGAYVDTMPPSINQGDSGTASVNVQNPNDESTALNSGTVAMVTVHEQSDAANTSVSVISVHRDAFDAVGQHAGNADQIQRQPDGSDIDDSESVSGSVSAMADFSVDSIKADDRSAQDFGSEYTNKQNLHP
jgi:hypothetical protein